MNHRRGRSAHSILVGQPEVEDHLRYVGADKRVILKWISDKLWHCGGGFIWLRTGSSRMFLRTYA